MLENRRVTCSKGRERRANTFRIGPSLLSCEMHAANEWNQGKAFCPVRIVGRVPCLSRALKQRRNSDHFSVIDTMTLVRQTCTPRSRRNLCQLWRRCRFTALQGCHSGWARYERKSTSSDVTPSIDFSGGMEEVMQSTGLKLLLLVSSMIWCIPMMGQQNSLRLLTPNVGWTLWDSRLLWTETDGRQWRDISPAGSKGYGISAVFFLDASHGWVLLASPDARSDGSQLRIVSTSNSGLTWSDQEIKLPERILSTLDGSGEITFGDDMHGWLLLRVKSSANFSLAILLYTDDGGVTWKQSPQKAPAFGAIRLQTVSKGWLAGGPGDEHLYTTDDTTSKWKEVSLPPPPEVGAQAQPTYHLPGFSDLNSGLLPVIYSSSKGSTLVLFRTGDGGKTWLESRKIVLQGNWVPLAIVNSELIIASISGATLESRFLSADGATSMHSSDLRKASTYRGDHIPSFQRGAQVSFTDTSHGWLVASGNAAPSLLATADGGISWADVTPPSVPLPAALPALPAPSADDTPREQGGAPAIALNVPAETHISTRLGFHKCDAASTTQMQTWWTSSRYFDVGVYIGGMSRSCPNTQLSASWFTAVTGQGWGVMPLWPGPQAPCADTKFPNEFSSNPVLAQAEGTTEANSAANVASGFGLAGTVIYYDMESYNSSTCGPAVAAFVKGWTIRLQTLGYLAGVYGSPGNAQTDWTQISPLADEVWIAKTPAGVVHGKATIWGLSPLCDEYSQQPCGFWAEHARIHHYLAHTYETYGGTEFQIDNDVEDAVIAGGQATKSHTYSFTTIDDPAGSQLYATAINDIRWVNHVGTPGQVTGYYDSSQHSVIGFLDANGTFSDIISNQSSGSATEIFGISNIPFLVGSNSCIQLVTGQTEAQYASSCTGFLYNSGAFTWINYPGTTDSILTGINDAGQIVGWYLYSGAFLPFIYNYQLNSAYGPITCQSCGPDPILFAGLSINGYSQIVSNHPDGSGNYHAVLYNYGSDGTVTNIDYPAATSTVASGINDSAQVVGYYTDSGGAVHGFRYDQGTFVSIDAPGAILTGAAGINNDGQIVGYYEDLGDNYHGFLAQ